MIKNYNQLNNYQIDKIKDINYLNINLLIKALKYDNTFLNFYKLTINWSIS